MTRGGWRRLQNRLGDRRRRILDVVDVDVLARDLTRPVRPRPAPRLTMVTIGPTEPLPVLRWPAESAPFPAFRARGDTGFFALRDGQPVGWIWLSRVSHRDPWSGLDIRLAADEAYAYALWTSEDARADGSGQLLVSRMLEACQADPALSLVYGWVDKRNRQSQVLLRLLGFQDVQSLRRVRVLGHGLVRRGTDTPAYGPMSRQGRHSEPVDP